MIDNSSMYAPLFPQVTNTIVFVAAAFTGWHAETLAFLRSKFDPTHRQFADDTLKLLPAHLKVRNATLHVVLIHLCSRQARPAAP